MSEWIHSKFRPCCWSTLNASSDDGKSPCSTDQVMSEGLLVLHVLEAVFADPQLRLLPIILWERREVPGVDLKVPYLDLVHVLHFGDLVKNHRRCSTVDIKARWAKFSTGHLRSGRNKEKRRSSYRLVLLLQSSRCWVHLCIRLQRERERANSGGKR